jgi:hypothetical protein
LHIFQISPYGPGMRRTIPRIEIRAAINITFQLAIRREGEGDGSGAGSRELPARGRCG